MDVVSALERLSIPIQRLQDAIQRVPVHQGQTRPLRRRLPTVFMLQGPRCWWQLI
jgi:hypothetical protein